MKNPFYTLSKMEQTKMSRSSGAVLLGASFTRVKTLAYRYVVPPEHREKANNLYPKGIDIVMYHLHKLAACDSAYPRGVICR